MAAAARSGPGQRGPYKWTEDRVRRELAAFTAGRDGFPTKAEFTSAGHEQLWRAMHRLGGARYWARELSLVLAPRQDKQRLTRTEAIAAAQRVIAEHGRLPNAVILSRLGYGKLSGYVYRCGGARRFLASHLTEDEPADSDSGLPLAAMRRSG